jgi:hypothetical protein
MSLLLLFGTGDPPTPPGDSTPGFFGNMAVIMSAIGM